MTTDSTRRLARGADGTEHVLARIVVDSHDEEMVCRLLADVTVGPDEPARVVGTIDFLDLRLLEIDDIEAIVEQLPEAPAHATTPSTDDALDRLLAWLRSEGPRQFGRVPQMGKERVVLAGEGRPIPSPTKPSTTTITPKAAFGPFADPAPRRPVRVANAGASDLFPVVGILDSSVVCEDQSFGDVVALIPEGSELAPGDVKQALQGHGTFVTGLVNAQAPSAGIRVCPILMDDGFGTAWDAAEGMVALKDAGVHLINMSVGTITGDDQPPFCLQRAVERLRDEVVLVAAAGNVDTDTQNPAAPVWPAALAGVLAVGSITTHGVTSAFSSQESWIDLAAVGENVRSSFTTGDVVCPLDGGGRRVRHFWGSAIWSGTSFAAATVTGRLAALAGKRGGPPMPTIRDLADQLRTGRLADDVVRQP